MVSKAESESHASQKFYRTAGQTELGLLRTGFLRPIIQAYCVMEEI